MKYLPFVVLFFLIILESSVTTLPLVLLFLIFYTVFTRSESVFFIAFFAGLLLDILMLRPLGVTSIFFLVIIFLILLYENKFEIGTMYFVMIATFVMSFLYLIFFPVSQIYLILPTCVIFSMIFFMMIKKINTPKLKAY